MTSVVKWPTIRLGDIAEFRNGVNYNKSSFGVGIKVIGVSDFQNFTKPKYEELEQINPKGIVTERNILHDGDIIFVRSNGNRELIGRSLFVEKPPEEVTHSAFTIRLRFSTNNVIPRFYAYCFRSQAVRQKLTAYGGGTNISNLNQEILSALEVPYPQLLIQHKIASILSVYDDLIEKNTRRIKILEEMAQTIYNEWFVKFRFPGHENLKMVGSELGMIPEGWSIKTLEEVCTTITDGSHWSPKAVDDGFPMASVKDMHDWGLDKSKCKIISKDDYGKLVSNNCKPQKNDILIAKDGSYLKHIFVVENDMNLVILSSIAILRPQNNICPHFFAMHLKDDSVKARMRGYVSGVAVPRIVLKDFRKFKILLPIQELQDKWCRLVMPMIHECWRLIDKNENLSETRDLLLPRLISGEIDVSELDIDIGSIKA